MALAVSCNRDGFIEEQTGDGGGAVPEGMGLTANGTPEEFRNLTGGDGHHHQNRGPETEKVTSGQHSGNQGKEHVGHQTGRGAAAVNMGGRSNQKIHLALASFQSFLPSRMVCTRGSWPGQM